MDKEELELYCFFIFIFYGGDFRYTLWNAEYRVSLMRKFDVSPGSAEASVLSGGCGASNEDEECEERDGGDGADGCDSSEGRESSFFQTLGHLSPAALDYIQELKLDLAALEKVRRLSISPLYF